MSSAPGYQSHQQQPDPARSGHSLSPSSSFRSHQQQQQHQQHQQQQSPTQSHQQPPPSSPSSASNQPQVTFPTPPNQQQEQFQQPQFQVVSEYNLLVTDSTSQIDAASTTHIHHNFNSNHQQQRQPLQEQGYYDQYPENHSRQSSQGGGDQQPHTLDGSPYTPPSDTAQSPHNDTLDKFNTDATAAPTATVTPEFTKAKLFRRRVMRMATVPRLQWLWGLLALFGSMAWFAMMPAYAFRNKLEPAPPANPTHTYFLVATVGTSIAALWQSLCPFLVRKSQQELLPRIINHPITQSTTIAISVILTILNFFSWIVLAANKEGGAKTNCTEGPLSGQSGYTAQCRGVNVAIVLNVVVFLLWLPIAAVIVCGTIERGLWWWGEDDGWAQHQAEGLKKGGANMMSEEEFDLKIGLGKGKGRGNGSQGRLSYYADEEEEAMESRPAFVTPIASQYRSSVADEEGAQGDLGEAAAPSSYRQHHQRRQQQQQQQQRHQQQASQDHEEVTILPRGGPAAGGVGAGAGGLVRKTSTTSLAPSISARLSTFFGQGWQSGQMPPPPAPEAPPPTPPIPVHHRPIRLGTTSMANNGQDDVSNTGGDKASLHGDSYTTQWHNRRYDEWS
ncbi:hypothetical protein BGW39_000231 [Mortierella sp. 14UC]|nr:hypothetical protein BGW39_000231 [Mortierella sp. 14UC]